MAFSIIQTTATGVSNAFPINFTLGFNNRNEVTCQVNNEVDGLGAPVYRTLSWVNDGLVNVLPGTLIPAGQPVVFKRTVTKTALIHDYSNGEAIEEENLDESNKQNLMAIHELFDGRFTSAFQQDLDMGTHKITNLVAGSAATDAVNKTQLDAVAAVANASAPAAAASAAAALADRLLADADVVLTHADVVLCNAYAANLASATNFYAGSTGGTANNPTAVTGCTVLSAGQRFTVKFSNSNSTGMTINFDGLGAKPVKKFAGGGKVDVGSGDIPTGFIGFFAYDGTDMVLLNAPTYSVDVISVASAATVVLTSMTGDYATLTGVTGISAFTMNSSDQKTFVYTGAGLSIALSASLTYGGATTGSLVLATGDIFVIRKDASAVRVVDYLPAGGAAGLNSPTFTGTPIVPTAAPGTNNTQAASTAFVLANGGAGKVQDFRLTLTTLTPVTTADVSGATTIYCTPYKGNQIALYNGSTWVNRTSAEFSLALGTLVAGKPYDVFCYDNAGVPTLEFLVWTNDTTRATALVYQDGVLVKSGAVTRRYLGTFYTTATTTTEDSLVKRYLWNYYNRVNRAMLRRESAVSWTYSSNAAWRQSNANTANQLNFFVGVVEDSVRATHMAQVSNGDATNRVMQVAIGLNATTGIGNCIANAAQNNNTYMGGSGLSAYIDTLPALGLNYLAMLELGSGAGTQTWYGSGTYGALGISGRVLA